MSDLFANGALMMQAFAEDVDAQITALKATYSAFPRRPTLIRSLGVDDTTISSGGLISLPFTTNVFSNRGSSWPGWSSLASGWTPFYEGGAWIFGVYIKCTVDGATTATSQRQVTMTVQTPTGLAPTSVQNFSGYGGTIFDSGVAGGDFITATGTAIYQPIQGSAANQGLLVQFIHANTASTMTVKAESFMWMHKLSELES
jgi:hypothetical protein